MKFIVAIVTAFMLSGCFYQTVSDNDIQGAIIICGGFDRVQSISSSFNGSELVTCVNRNTYFINAQNIETALKQHGVTGKESL